MMQIIRLENMLTILDNPKEIEWTKREIERLEVLAYSEEATARDKEKLVIL